MKDLIPILSVVFYGITAFATIALVYVTLVLAKNADKIIILDGGKIIQQGTHNQLLDQEGYYRELYLKQLSEKELT